MLIYWESSSSGKTLARYFMLRIVYVRLDAAKCISESGGGDLDRGKQ